MKNLKEVARATERSGKRELLFPVIFFTVVVSVFLAAGMYFDYTSDMQSVDLLRQSTKRAVVQCYAIEGAYPENVEYLEEYYGLEYNHDKYFIDYEVFASNVMPNVEVFERE